VTRVGVVGAGVTGLALTHHLAERGVDVVTLEAGEEPGGVVRSRTVEGRVVEMGPQRVRLTPGVRQLSEAGGVAEDLLVAEGDLPLWVYHDGALRRAPLSPREALTTDLLSWRGKLRVLAEPLTGHDWDDETVREFLARKFGPEAADRFMGLLYAGLYGSDPADMPVEHSLGRMLQRRRLAGRSILLAMVRRLRSDRETPPIASFEDGLGQLTAGLARTHADRVRLDTPVEGIAERGDGYALATPGGAERVDEVVLTVPAPVAGDLLADVAPGTADAVSGLTYNPMAAAFLRTDADLDGLGYKIAPGEPLRSRGVTYNGGIFDHPSREGVCTAYLGGAGDPELLAEDDATVGAVARDELADVLDADVELLDVHRVPYGMPAYDDSWDGVRAVEPPDGVHLACNYLERAGVPGRIREAKSLAADIAEAAGADEAGAERAPADD
jgi:oxygen-dependent protoporphyrinogen oxidase